MPQGAVRPHSVVKVHKVPDQNDCFLQGVEKFTIKKLVPHLGIELSQ